MLPIEFQDVSLSFDEKRILTDISFELERGEMMFLTGESGSGKSVLLRLAMGLEQPDAGKILIDGVNLAGLDETELVNLRGERMGMVFQEDSLFTGMTVYDNAAFRLAEQGVAETEVERAVQEVLEFVGLQHDADKFPEELSGGMRRRLEIARALIGWPSIMLFDEPASGLDPITAEQVLDLIIRARDVYGISSLYVTKRLDEMKYLTTRRARKVAEETTIEEVCDNDCPRTRVMVLENGSIVFTGSIVEFEQNSSPAVTRLTQTKVLNVPPVFFSDPWDRNRKPKEKIL